MQHKLNGFEAYFEIERRLKNNEAGSVIRLGDGEGAMLGYPAITSKDNVMRSIVNWFGHSEFTDAAISSISEQMREAVKAADIIGVPRDRQVEKHPLYAAVFSAVDHYSLFNHGPVIADAALHRQIQFGLLFRKLLNNRDFVGLITPRHIAALLKQRFNIKEIKHYSVKGESRFEGTESTEHYPDGFNHIREMLKVPYPGALFLVGAGGLGKIYCQWIKECGGFALDIGAIFDAWAQVKSRLVHPCHNLEQYEHTPKIDFAEAVARYNSLCDYFEMDTARVDTQAFPDKKNLSW